MPYQRQDWPLTPDQLLDAIAGGEQTLVEFKRAWWGAHAPDAKATIARGIIALANTVGPNDLGLILVGVDDPRRGAAVFSQTNAPEPEAVTQVMQAYIHPPPDIQCRHSELPEGRISAIGVFRSRSRPHYPIREDGEILSLRDVYVRRGSQVGVMTIPELERMIRDKSALLASTGDHPLQFGVSGVDHHHPPTVLFRVTNVVTEPLNDVSVLLDAFLVRDRSICGRSALMTNQTLRPRESRELSVRLPDVQMWRTAYEDKSVILTPHSERSLISDHWLYLVFHVSFRGTDGFTHQHQVRRAVHW